MPDTRRAGSGMGRLVQTVAGLILGAVLGLEMVAHDCGPPRIELQVGETCPWRITADRLEVASDYAPSLAGPDGVCAVLPLRPFKSRHGDFIINGLAPGTNTLAVNWAYSGTGASGRCLVTIVVRPASGGVGQQTSIQEGSLSTTYGASIPAERLRALLDFYIPTNCAKLFVLTECFGGNVAFSSYFRNLQNLAIASATSPNQYALYGGYHDDAARALKPGVGRTAFDVHETASLGKDLLAPPAVHGTDHSKSNYFNNSEFPRFAGGLNLTDFSLETITAASQVRSRHIIVYMGAPGTGTNSVQTIDGITIPTPLGAATPIVDTADRDAVKANFAGHLNTTVHTVGGVQPASGGLSGVNGWDYRGDFYGLRQAFSDVQRLITNSPNPSAEQFILFVGDHGGRGNAAPAPTTPVAAPEATTGLISNFRPLGLNDPALGQMLSDLDNIPGFQFSMSVQSAPPPNPAPHQPGLKSPFVAGMLALEVSAPGVPPVILNSFEVNAIDIDLNGTIGNVAGETYDVFFPISEDALIPFLATDGINLSLVNRSAASVGIQRIAFSTGSIERPDDVVPPPRFTQVRASATGQMEITVVAVPGFSFELERSLDLASWTPVRRITFTTDVTVLTEPAPAAGRGYYRLKAVGF